MSDSGRRDGTGIVARVSAAPAHRETVQLTIDAPDLLHTHTHKMMQTPPLPLNSLSTSAQPLHLTHSRLHVASV
jgi:hypothetical protein